MKSRKKKYTTVLDNSVSLEIQSGHADIIRLGQEGHATCQGKNKGNLGKCSKLFLCTLKFMHLCTRNFVLFYYFLLCASSFSIFSTLNTQNNPIIILACSGEKGLRTSVLHQTARCMAPGLRFEHEPVSM